MIYLILHVYDCMLFCAKYSNFYSDKGEILNGELIKSYMFQMLCVSDTIAIHNAISNFLGVMFLSFPTSGSSRFKTTKSSYRRRRKYKIG